MRARASGFYVYAGKEQNEDIIFGNLGKSAQVVARLCNDLPAFRGHKVFFENWYSTRSLFHHLKYHGIHAVGSIKEGRLKITTYRRKTS